MNDDIENLIEDREGWIWPKYDWGCWTFLNNPKRGNVPERISGYVKNKRVVIQAGGNAGMYPRLYENFFDTVYTFEPDPLNFYCLVQNTTSKTIKLQACLGNLKKTVSLSRDCHKENGNCGGFFVEGTGIIPILKVDDLVLSHCDLIHLDIEGYEKEALLGAEKTIQNFSPVIVLELVKHSERYGATDSEIIEILRSWNYKLVESIKKEDYIFMKSEVQ